MLNTSRSYSRPNTSSSQRIDGLQRAHGVLAAVLVAAAHPDAEVDLAAGARGEVVAAPRPDRRRPARTDSTASGCGSVQVMRCRPSPSIVDLAGIAVRQHHRAGAPVGGDGDGVARHHVRPVGEIGDAAEAFRLALGEEAAVGDIQAGQFGVVLRRDAGFDLQHAGIRQIGDDEIAVLKLITVRPSLDTIDGKTQNRLASPSRCNGPFGAPAGLRRILRRERTMVAAGSRSNARST